MECQRRDAEKGRQEPRMCLVGGYWLTNAGDGVTKLQRGAAHSRNCGGTFVFVDHGIGCNPAGVRLGSGEPAIGEGRSRVPRVSGSGWRTSGIGRGGDRPTSSGGRMRAGGTEGLTCRGAGPRQPVSRLARRAASAVDCRFCTTATSCPDFLAYESSRR